MPETRSIARWGLLPNGLAREVLHGTTDGGPVQNRYICPQCGPGIMFKTKNERRKHMREHHGEEERLLAVAEPAAAEQEDTAQKRAEGWENTMLGLRNAARERRDQFIAALQQGRTAEEVLREMNLSAQWVYTNRGNHPDFADELDKVRAPGTTLAGTKKRETLKAEGKPVVVSAELRSRPRVAATTKERPAMHLAFGDFDVELLLHSVPEDFDSQKFTMKIMRLLIEGLDNEKAPTQ